LVPFGIIRRDRVGHRRRHHRRPFASDRSKGSSIDGVEGRLAEIAATIKEIAVLTLVIGILIIVVIGAILFWVIDKFCPDARLAQLLKLLVVLVCLGAIVNRLLPLLGYSSVL
jgi:hypothetical protein